MRTSNAISQAVTAWIGMTLLVAVAGCSSQAVQAPPTQELGAPKTIQQQIALARLNRILGPHQAASPGLHGEPRSFMDKRAVGKRLVFVSVYGSSSGGVVNIYPESNQRQNLVGQIVGGIPEGLATEADGTLYVANSTASNEGVILVYAPPYTKPPKLTLDDPGYFPNGVAISRSGIVAAANFCAAPSCYSAGNVVFYQKNSTEPCASVADATNFFILLNDAFDHRGNLYVTGLDPYFNAVVGEVKGGCAATTITPLTTANALRYTYAVHITKAGRVVLINYTGGNGYDVLDVYRRPKNGSLGSPIRETEIVDGSTLPIDYVFSTSGARVFTAEQGGGGVLNTFDFHHGGPPERSIVVGNSPLGVAASPPWVP